MLQSAQIIKEKMFMNFREAMKQFPILDDYWKSSFQTYGTLGLNIPEAEIVPGEKFSLEYLCPDNFQAYHNVTHGGIVAALLDSSAGICALALAAKEGKRVLTRSMEVSYRKPLRPGTTVILAGKIVEVVQPKTIIAHATIEDTRGTTIAFASCQFEMVSP
jgi:uncharacterized protein (TIGR00369 family)